MVTYDIVPNRGNPVNSFPWNGVDGAVASFNSRINNTRLLKEQGRSVGQILKGFMNTIGRWFLRLVFISIFSGLLAAPPDAATAEVARVPVAEWRAKSRSEHQTEWSSVSYATNPATGRVRAMTNSFVELATSLNRRDEAGQWQPSSSAFQITATGAKANLAGHRVTLAGNINTAGAVLIEKDGVRMQGHPLCIAYYDPVDGRSLSLAELTGAGGWLVNSNEIVFSNCFDGIRASIRYRNSIDGIEQDLILHERPPVTPEDLGFSTRTRLELFTEWIGDTPIPQKETRLLLRGKDTEARKQMAEPDFTDSTLTFGLLRMARGKAFTTGGTNAPSDAASAPDAVTVGKRFEVIDGRKILIEAVEYRNVSALLDKLPVAPFSGVLTNAAARPNGSSLPSDESGEGDKGERRVEALAAVRKKVDQTTVQSIRLLPAKRLAQTRTDARIQTAANANSKRETRNAELAAAEPPAFIVDWQLTLTTGLNNFTLHSSTNYLCAGTITFNGTTRIQGGTVVKFAPAPAAAVLKFSGPVICDTDMHHPAYFVSKRDATVGEVMEGNTTPASYTGALELMTTGNKLKHLRVRNANVAVKGWDIDVQHSQFTACNTVFNMPEDGAGSGPCRLGNVLVANSGYIFSGVYYNVIATHLTVNNCYGALTSDPQNRSTAHFINSLLVNIDSMGVIPAPMLTASHILPSTPAEFQTLGGASHYLAAGSSYRGAGITTIDPTLLADLKQTTTYPPTILTGTMTISQTLGLNPAVIRNANGNPDKGYAYPAMDYLVRNLVIQGSAGSPVTLLVTNGAVLGFDPIPTPYVGNGLSFGAYSDFISVGLPGALNRFVLSHAIQESCSTVPNYFTLLHGVGLSPHPNAFMRFSDLSLSAGNSRHVASWSGGFIKLAFQDSQIRGGTMYLGLDNPNHLVALTNTLLEQVDFTYHPYTSYPNNPNIGLLHARNNLFKGGLLAFDMNPGGPSPLPWTFRDNLFDRTAISQSGGGQVDGNFNAYVQVSPTTPRLQPQGANDRPLLTASPAYEAGPFGSNYLPSTATQLINQGSRTAASAGLYHYATSKTAGTKEGVTQVDIGLHYVAANSANQPTDQDGDGLADYIEDTNGNGAYYTGDTGDFFNADSDGDGLPDNFETITTLTSPRSPNTGNTATTDGNKDPDGDGLSNLEEMKLGKNPLMPDVASPNFSPVGSSYYVQSQNVVISCPTAGATIRYTINGNEPDGNSTQINSGSFVTLTQDHIIKAKAWKAGWTTSETESQSYRISPPPDDPSIPPTLTVSPANGGTFSASDSVEILLEAQSVSGLAKVQLYRGDYKVAESTTSPLRYTVSNLPAGTYIFTAKAISSQGVVALSSPITITINASGPLVSLNGVQPFFTSSPGALLAVVTGVNPNAMSTLTLNGSPLVPRAGEFKLNVPLVEGENTFTLVATDNQSHSAQATTKVYLDSILPVIAISTPANNSSFNTARINVQGTFTETSLKRITVSGVLAFRSGNTFEARNVPLAAGANLVTATVEDITGNASTAIITVTGSATPVDPVQLTVTPVGGFAPLGTAFSMVGNYPGTFQNVYYDLDGDGVTDQTAANLNPINHTYSSAGQYFPVVTIQTTAGRFSSLGGWNSGAGFNINVQQPPVQLNVINSIIDPVDLKVGGPSAHLFVLLRSGAIVNEYDSSEIPVRSFALPAGSVPTGLDVDSTGCIYVALSSRHQVAKYKLVSGSYTLDTAFNGTGLIGKSNQTSGTGNGEFNTPYDVAITPDGAGIAVSDSLNHRIQNFKTADGSFIGAFGAQGSSVGQFNAPKGLAYDGAGYLYIVDSGNNRIALALSSAVTGTSGSSGSALGQFQGAVNLCVGPRGIYVGETGNNRVQIFNPFNGGHSSAPTPFGTRLSLSSELGLSQPNAIAPIADFLAEKIYIADTGHNRVIKATLPETSTPDATWNTMKASLLAGNIDQAVLNFSSASAEDYRLTFTAIGVAALPGHEQDADPGGHQRRHRPVLFSRRHRRGNHHFPSGIREGKRGLEDFGILKQAVKPELTMSEPVAI